MKAKFFNSDVEYDFESFWLLTLVMENKTYLLDYLTYLHHDFRGKERYWVFTDSKKANVDLESCSEIVPDFFNLEINSKKNVNALYRLLKKSYYDKLKPDISELKDKAVSIVKEICLDFDIELCVTNEISEDDLFKILDLRFNADDLDIKEKFIKYCLVVNELRRINVFFVLFLHQFFDGNDIQDIIHELSYHRIRLFNLETSNSSKNNEFESTVLMDSDLCVIS